MRFVIALILFSLVMVVASQGVMPDSLLYPAKRAIEETRVFFSSHEGGKADEYMRMAQARFDEFTELLKRNKPDEAERALEAYETNLEKARNLVSTAKEKKTATEEFIRNTKALLEKNREVLRENAETVEKGRNFVNHALETTQGFLSDLLD